MAFSVGKLIDKAKIVTLGVLVLGAAVFTGIHSYLLINHYTVFTQMHTPTPTPTPKVAYKGDSPLIQGSLYSIRLREIPGQQNRQAIVPTYHITFSVPPELATGQELHSSIHDENNADTVIRLYRKDTKYTKDSNGYDTADNTIIFSFNFPYGTDPMLSTGQYVVGPSRYSDPNKTLANKLDFVGSMLQSRAISFNKFYDTDHMRYKNKYTDTFKGIVRMDLLTLDHTNPTIGLLYTCYDQSTKGAEFCEKTFQLFVSSLRLEEGELKDPPPNYAEDDVFAVVPFAKRSFDVGQMVKTYQHGQIVPVSLYFIPFSPELTTIGDDSKLRNMKCLPDQIFYRGNNNFEIANLGEARPPYSPILLKDKNVLKILSLLQERVQDGNTISQFALCLTDDKRYLVKYNEVPKSQQTTGIALEDSFVARFVTIDSNWQVQSVVDIQNKAAKCSRFLALTNDNMLYFECRPINLQGEQFYKSMVYKIDIEKKSYSLLWSCTIPYEATGKDPKTFCN